MFCRRSYNRRNPLVAILIAFFIVLLPAFAMADNLIRTGRWVFFADTVMGGVSQGSAQFETTDQGPALRLSGSVSTENNGGFIQVRTELAKKAALGAKGIKITLKGNGDQYFIHLRNGATLVPWHYYGQAFTAPSGWIEVRLPFDSFERSYGIMPRTVNVKSLKSIGIVAYGKDYEADVSVLNMEFYD